MGTIRGHVVAVSLLVASTPLGIGPTAARAGVDWEPTGLTQPADRLMTPASGALFAVIREDA